MANPTTNVATENNFKLAWTKCPDNENSICPVIDDNYVEESGNGIEDAFLPIPIGSNDKNIWSNEDGFILRKENLPTSDFFIYGKQENDENYRIYQEVGVGFMVDNEGDFKWGLTAGYGLQNIFPSSNVDTFPTFGFVFTFSSGSDD